MFSSCAGPSFSTPISSKKSSGHGSVISDRTHGTGTSTPATPADDRFLVQYKKFIHDYCPEYLKDELLDAILRNGMPSTVPEICKLVTNGNSILFANKQSTLQCLFFLTEKEGSSFRYHMEAHPPRFVLTKNYGKRVPALILKGDKHLEFIPQFELIKSISQTVKRNNNL